MKEEKKENMEIDVKGKNGKEIIEAYSKVSKSIQEIYEYLDKYDNPEEVLKQYKKVKKSNDYRC